MSISKYVQRAKDMVKEDRARDALFSGIDDMWHGIWTLPDELKSKPDMREIIDLSPHDALKSGTTILSTSLPHWSVQPLLENPGELDRAERTAYAIDYNYRQMNRRGTGTLLWDMVHSCLRYDAVAVWLDYLPYWLKGRTPTLRQKHALRGGEFAGKAYNVRNVHVQKDDYGPNCVLLSTNMAAQEVVSKWGDRAKELEKKLRADEDTGKARFIYQDLMLYEGDQIRRIAWGNITQGTSEEEGTDEYILMDEIVDTPFMPWIVRFGGSGLETLPEYSIHPLLAPLYLTHKWKDLNVFQSVMQSEIIKYGRSPRVVTTTPSGEGVAIDYEGGTTVNLDVTEKAEAWKPAPIDPNLEKLVDRNRAEVSSATLPRILQNPEFAGNTPFASINAMIQTALGGLSPAKVLCEGAHSELATRMIEWAKFTERPLLAIRTQTTSEKKKVGVEVRVPVDELNPESVIVTCKLFAEAPTDFMQRLNAGILMNQQLKVPRSKILEDLGHENPDVLYDQWTQEQYDDTTVATDLQTMQAQAQMDLQMQAQQAMQSQQAAQPQGYPSNTQGLETGVPEGQGFNPNSGNAGMQPGDNTGQMNPAAGNPGVSLREQISGQDVTGAGI
jgi:hypothetical protein